MILVALLFITVGVADIVRERFRAPVGPVAGIIAGTVSAVAVAAGSGVSLGWAFAAAGVVAGWIVLTALPSSGQSGYLKLAFLGAALAAAWAFPVAEVDADSALARWFESLPYSAAANTDVATLALAVGSVLLLIETANIIVRLVLAAAPRMSPEELDASTPARRSWFGRDTRAAVSPAPRADLPLKGGRVLGPFERIFLFALVMAGQFTALAAVVAAKGIIRFPEISKDTTRGSKAEYFLVGSFASWAVVLVVAVVVGSA